MAITERRLTAILAADVCDFSKMMGENEDRTIKNLRTCRELIESSISSHKGNIFNTAGDSIVAEFSSVVDAVNCAVNFQETLRDRNSSVPETSKMEFRVGINLGDIIIEEDNRYGDGINIAARLEGLSEPGGICISGSVYNDIKSKLNLEFGAMGEQVLKNIAQPVSAYKIDFGGDDPAPIASVSNLESTPIVQPGPAPEAVVASSSSHSDKPSIAVLPFDNMSNDPEQEYFTDGITEDIITSISRLRFLNVIARNSIFIYKGKSPDIVQVAKEFNARYVIEGSVRKSNSRTRINVQLIDGQTGSHLWAEKLDNDVEDDFEQQDQIVDTLFKKLSLALLECERNRAITLPINEMGVWDLAHRANWHFLQHQRDDFKEAINFADKAIALDANNPIAWAVKGVAGETGEFLGIITEGHDNIGFIKKAITLNPSDALCHAYLGHAFATRGDIQNGITSYQRSLDLNPDLQFTLMGLGWILVFSDKYEEGRVFLEKAIKMTSNDPVTGRIFIALAASYIGEDNYSEALKWINQAVEMNSQYPAKLIQAMVINEIGDRNQADQLAQKFKAEYTYVSINDWWKRWQTTSGDVGTKIGQGLVKLGLLKI